MSKTWSKRKAKSVVDRICCLMLGESHVAPEGFCENRRHGHMTRGKVDELVSEGRMEWVSKVEERMTRGKLVDYEVEQPVARFVPGPEWRKTISDPAGAAPMAVMQLV